MKLISMTDFVLEQKEKLKNSEQGFNIEKYDFIINVCNYAKFLKQPLEQFMFVPCDENGNVLEKPNAGMFGYDHVYNNYKKPSVFVPKNKTNKIYLSALKIKL